MSQALHAASSAALDDDKTETPAAQVGSEGQAPASSTGEADDKKAEPSPAKDDKKSVDASEKPLIDVLRDAVKPPEAKKADEGKASDPKKEESAKSDAEKKIEDKGEDDKDPPFHEHPAWKRQLAARREAEARVGELEPLARKAHALDNYMVETGLTGENVLEILKVGALILSNPTEARIQLQGYIDIIDQQLGNTLPAELRKRVDDGELDEKDALDLSRSRASKALAEERAAKEQERAASIVDQEKEKTRVAAVGKASTDYVTALKASDPDFGHKEELMKAYVSAELAARGGKPAQTPEEAKAIINTAYEKATAQLLKLRPKKEERQPLRTDRVQPQAASTAGSLIDAIRVAARGAQPT